MSGTYGRCQSPLKSGLPSGVRGAGPLAGLAPSSAAPPGACAKQRAGIDTATASVSAALVIRLRVRVDICWSAGYCVGAFLEGPPSSAEPANTRLPSGSFTVRALQVLVPSLDRKPSTFTWSPIFSESLVQPLRVRVFGGPPSHCQWATVPLSSLVS